MPAHVIAKEERVRGHNDQTGDLFSYVSPEARVPKDHPLRVIRMLTDAVLERLSPRFDQIYATTGRPSIPPEQLLRALLLQPLFSIRSERLLMEQLDYNLLFRWFVGLSMDAPVWTPEVFSMNRDRFLDGAIAATFFEEVRAEAKHRRLLSDEHFTVDGTLLEAWASHKSFRPKDAPPAPPDDPGNAGVDFRGQRRSNATHASTTDPDSRLAMKSDGSGAFLAYRGHLLMENRHGLIVGAVATTATGTAEREAATTLLQRVARAGVTVGADKGYDVTSFVSAVRAMDITPHIAQNTTNRRSAIDRRTTRHGGYAVSQQKRKRVEEAFGWMKTIGMLRKLRHRGLARVDWLFTFTAAAYNLRRLGRLLDAGA
jgi:transposase